MKCVWHLIIKHPVLYKYRHNVYCRLLTTIVETMWIRPGTSRFFIRTNTLANSDYKKLRASYTLKCGSIYLFVCVCAYRDFRPCFWHICHTAQTRIGKSWIYNHPLIQLLFYTTNTTLVPNYTFHIWNIPLTFFKRNLYVNTIPGVLVFVIQFQTTVALKTIKIDWWIVEEFSSNITHQKNILYTFIL